MEDIVPINILYDCKKNNILEDIHDIEETINDTIKDVSIKEEEIVPIINKDN